MDFQRDGSLGSNSGQENGKKLVCRHSFERVIEKLEEVFSQMPKSKNHVIEQLSEKIGLDATQVKISFDNKRRSIEAQRDIEEREIIHLKNKRLYAENLQMCFELKKRFCATCNNPEQQRTILQDLQNENAILREEITMISNVIDRFKEDPEGYLFLLRQDYLNNYNDPNGLDLELRLECYNDPNGPDLELRLG
ncbi:homeobox-leucine zipper protein PROTODERMAL FACTOR 2-like [Lycium barbarum]|uniref:homeobox-leucine zipper protein PROTODERMAL FACTOR 2-like n=1 Tax=Lycium barbarum TaxID=112863 RepID=UPI00293F7149|nr:homeobox-leucine zipper protein PROTODERMAL FACTOR 2-like [Lycium barbarum]